MTHLPYVASAYTFGVLVPFVLGVGAWLRGRRVRRQLAVIDRRATRRR